MSLRTLILLRHAWELASAELDEVPPTRIDDHVYAAPGLTLGRV